VNLILILYGFVKKGTALEQEFLKFSPLETDEYRKAAIIKARFLEGSKATRSMLIEGLESTKWAFPHNPREIARRRNRRNRLFSYQAWISQFEEKIMAAGDVMGLTKGGARNF